MIQAQIKSDWLKVVTSFLYLVELACDEIEEPKHIDEFGNKYNTNLNIAVIYNMNHAIEIFIKTSIRIADNNREEDITKNGGHNAKRLFVLLKKRMSDKNLEEIINSIDVKKDTLALFAQQEIKQFETYLIEIQKIIDYYFELEFWDKNEIIKKDVQNTFFKYPENKDGTSTQIDYLNVLFDRKIIIKIKEDVETLRSILSSINSVFICYYWDEKGRKRS